MARKPHPHPMVAQGEQPPARRVGVVISGDIRGGMGEFLSGASSEKNTKNGKKWVVGGNAVAGRTATGRARLASASKLAAKYGGCVHTKTTCLLILSNRRAKYCPLGNRAAFHS